ncbi:hypothetical protein GCM10019016_017020 [Streptomyces prasinosporus]|uniref:Uncharacterized protein n=1 Tax=Streptomyces prasinosporus TaxID=68256 RepID=A0ABP6THA7_9ACTN
MVGVGERHLPGGVPARATGQVAGSRVLRQRHGRPGGVPAVVVDARRAGRAAGEPCGSVQRLCVRVRTRTGRSPVAPGPAFPNRGPDFSPPSGHRTERALTDGRVPSDYVPT